MPLRSHQRQAFERSPQTARIDACQLSLGSAFVFRLLFPYGLSVVRRSIRQPLADDAFHGTFGALNVIYAKSDAVAISKVELCEISVQVLLFAMLVDAFHAALENAVEAFNGISVDVVANTFRFTVVDSFMAGELCANFKILTTFISHQSGFFGDVGTNDRRNLRNGSAIHMEAAGGAAALDKGQNDILMAPARFGFWLAFNAADKGFVGFNDFAFAAHRGHTNNAHRLANTMRHEPSGFQGNAQG